MPRAHSPDLRHRIVQHALQATPCDTAHIFQVNPRTVRRLLNFNARPEHSNLESAQDEPRNSTQPLTLPLERIATRTQITRSSSTSNT